MEKLQDLTLLNKFLFDQTMDIPEAQEATLQIILQDGAVCIFLNTKGTNDKEVSKELIDFLHYVEKTDDKSAEDADSERIQKIHECVKRIKTSEEMGVKYMQAWEEKIMEREKGRQEGRADGKVAGKVGNLEVFIEMINE